MTKHTQNIRYIDHAYDALGRHRTDVVHRLSVLYKIYMLRKEMNLLTM